MRRERATEGAARSRTVGAGLLCSMYLQASSASPKPEALVRFVRSLRTNRNIIDSWRTVANRYAATQDAKRAVRLRALVDAFGAEDDVAFHNAVGRLGVSVFSTSERDERGQEGTATRFAINGVVRLRVFRPYGNSEPPKAREMDPSEPLHGPAAADPAAVAVQEDCGGDPCATQQEVDDALVMLVVIDDEATTLNAEMNAEYAALVEYCNQNPWACGQEPALDQPRGGPSVPSAVYAQPCSIEFWNFAGAVVSTWGAVVAGMAALVGAPMTFGVSLAVVGATVTAASGGLMISYSAGMSLLDCKRRLA